MPSPATPVDAPSPPPLRWSRRAAVAWTAYALVQGALWVFTWELPAADWRYVLPVSLAGGWLWFLVAPLVARLARAATPARLGIAGAAAVHVLAAAGLAAIATTVRVAVNALVPGTEAIPFVRSFLYWLDLNVVTYAALVVMARTALRHGEYVRRARHALALERQCSRARLHYLQRQLQPHFVFNALNAVAELTREAPDLAAATLRRLARLLGATVERETAPELPLRDELALLAPYLDIQRIRFGDALRVDVAAEPAALDALVPSLLLQPLVENAVHHGIAVRGRGGQVTVRAAVRDGVLCLRVENDAAHAARRGGRRAGLGLRNTVERLRELYGDAAAFALRDEGDGLTVAEVRLPHRAAAPRAGDDGEPNAGDAGEPDAAPGPRIPAWLLFTGAWTGMAALWALQHLLRQWQAGAGIVWAAIGADVTAALLALAATPAIVALARRVPLRAEGWAPRLLVHLAAAALFAVLHVKAILLLWDPARALFVSAHLAQFSLDAMVYAAVVAWTQGRELAERARERALAGARLATEAARAEWRARAFAVHPRLLQALLEHAADVAPHDPERAESLVERLSELLRALLDVGDHDPAAAQAQAAMLREAAAVLGPGAGALLDDPALAPAWAPAGAPVLPGAGSRALTLVP